MNLDITTDWTDWALPFRIEYNEEWQFFGIQILPIKFELDWSNDEEAKPDSEASEN